jgi:hypothetical protein
VVDDVNDRFVKRKGLGRPLEAEPVAAGENVVHCDREDLSLKDDGAQGLGAGGRE